MEFKIKTDSTSDPQSNVRLIPSELIKIEQDFPDLIDSKDLGPLIDISTIDNEQKVDWTEGRESLSKEKFHCSQCNEEFLNKTFLQVHSAIHDTKRLCPVCDRHFKIEEVFISHVKSHLKQPIKCQKCPEVFLDKRSYNLHLYTHKKMQSYSCEYCLKEWWNKKDLRVHLRVHTNERPYSCDVCGKSFKQKGGLTSHSTVHSDKTKIITKNYTCEICKGSYVSVSSLNKHIRRIHEAGKTFPCPKCGENFLNLQQMKKHKVTLHPELVYNRVCSLCKEEFSSRETYRKHQQTHTERGEDVDQTSFETPIDCFLCGEQLYGMKAFAKHQLIHLLMTEEQLEEYRKVKKFKCKVCGKLFIAQSNLFRHMDVHLEKSFECTGHCSEKFTFLGIRKHLEWHFEQFYCSECKETFIGRKNYKKHKRIHPDLFKFTCKICVKRKFRCRRRLNTHYKMHHNFKCHLCHKKFITKFTLKEHIEIKHKVKAERLDVDVKYPSDSTVKVIKNVYSCKFCKKMLRTKHLLIDHLKLHKKRCFQCENCKKNFLYFSNWRFHIRQNICYKYFDNKTYTNMFKCMLCRKEYDELDSLSRHMRYHCIILKCKFCESKFKQKDLQEHITRAHPDEAKFSCDKCNCRFCTVIELNTHTKYFHKNMVIKCEMQDENEAGEMKTHDPDEDHSLVWIKEEPR